MICCRDGVHTVSTIINLMSKKLTRYIAVYGIGVYLLALLVISVAFREHVLQLKWMLWG